MKRITNLVLISLSLVVGQIAAHGATAIGSIYLLDSTGKLLGNLNGATLTVGKTYIAQANPTATSGTISKVEFYWNGVLLSSDTTKPYQRTWQVSWAGKPIVKAVPYSATGLAGTSMTVTFTNVAPTPSPSPSVTPTPTQTPTATPTATATPPATATPTPTIAPTPTVTPSPSPTPTPTPSTPTPTQTPTPEPTVSPIPTPLPTATPVATPTSTPAPSPSSSPTPTPTPAKVQVTFIQTQPNGADVYALYGLCEGVVIGGGTQGQWTMWLYPGMTYHVRSTARNAAGESLLGPELVYTTTFALKQTVALPALP